MPKHEAPQNEATWELVRQQSLNALNRFLSREEDALEIPAQVKVASTFISAYTRHEGSESARDAMKLTIGRQLTETPTQFRDFVRMALPDMPLPEMPALPSG